eukprot:CAMPEP_0181373914 /NCGR_PEP_ID=MMETSP1106-20121128/15679_1 /TAXON_ID=81844 /ORGANISM="Mantoniella antarctica, Strain SL-175" /LENGTH=136 /DNA_ID=CAMNT_0023491737 /DNA_START=1027 /DNA_END=1438 /DNA_ORIENTATION=-
MNESDRKLVTQARNLQSLRRVRPIQRSKGRQGSPRVAQGRVRAAAEAQRSIHQQQHGEQRRDRHSGDDQDVPRRVYRCIVLVLLQQGGRVSGCTFHHLVYTVYDAVDSVRREALEALRGTWSDGVEGGDGAYKVRT